MNDNVIIAGEFLASLFFVVSLSCLKKVQNCKKSIYFGVLGMAIAIGGTLINKAVTAYLALGISMAVGGLIGVIVGISVRFESLPQLVAIFNGLGGLSAILAAYGSYYGKEVDDDNFDIAILLFCVVIGTITLSGSLIAAAKLQGWVNKTLSGAVSKPSNVVLLLGTILLSTLFFFESITEVDFNSNGSIYFMVITVLSFFIGIFLSLAVGGADAPLLISVLNSLSGWSGAAAGLLTGYNALVIVGILVGSSGFILSIAMAAAMNRSIMSVILGGKLQVATKHTYDQSQVQIAKEDDVVSALLEAERVLFVPGFGLSQARAAGSVAEITKDLQARGKTVHFCVHPVAGRMPGHMSVLLSEVNIPFNLIYDLSEIQDKFSSYDVAVSIGCADTINPLAMEDTPSNIQGMPICPVHLCKKSFVLKRSPRLDSGYSGEPLVLLLKENNRTVLGDAKKSLATIQAKLSAIARDDDANNNETSVLFAPEEAEEPLPELPLNHVTIGILKESKEDEDRVAIDPKSARKLRKLGFNVYLQSGAGVAAGFSDEMYLQKSATILPDTKSVIEASDVVLKINNPTEEEVAMMRPHQHVICLVSARFNKEIVEVMQNKQLTVTALDQIPRISRAQKLDVLSSQAKCAGYRAVIEAASVVSRFLNAEVTASGKYPPVKSYVIGCGVAGLAAVGGLNALGSEVYAFDSRPIADEVESLGAKFVQPAMKIDASGVGGYARQLTQEEIQAQHDLTMQMCQGCDVIITTAAVPSGAPKLIFENMVAAMKPGSVIVDLAALSGGNCVLTQPGKTITTPNGVTIIGLTNLPSRMARQASEMFGNNLVSLLEEFGGGKQDEFFSTERYEKDVVVKNSTLLLKGELLTHPPIQVSKKPEPVATTETVKEPSKEAKCGAPIQIIGTIAICAVVFGLAIISPSESKLTVLLEMLLVLTMASLVGFLIIWSVPTSLHSHLMSLTNGISGVVVLSAMSLVASESTFVKSLSIAAVVGASINIAGGFTVTKRMFDMIRN
ncbi:hypothetical protein RCL1_003894 [Eukaryota sp. TZLM3-RCL]